jgi:anti-sigma factor RsiW
LRVLYSTHPLDVEGGGVHRVKPWFEGKVDFAPVVGFGGDDDFPLTGGSVAYFIDRKAAAYIYERRLHVATLLVYRAEGLPWSGVATVPLGHARAVQRTTHGFNVLMWRDGDLGYSLISDLNVQELETLGTKIAG